MTITDRAAESVSRLVAAAPTVAEIAAIDADLGLDAARQMLALIDSFHPPGLTLTDKQMVRQLAQYAWKLQRVAVALCADQIAEDDAKASIASIPDGLGKEPL